MTIYAVLQEIRDWGLLVLIGWALLHARRGGGLTRRARRRDEYAKRAVAYARHVGGSADEQLQHAYGCFRGLDEADNGKRDYAEREMALAVRGAFSEK